MSAQLMAQISLHSGSGWSGHVFFLVKHPILDLQVSSNSYKDVKTFCAKHNLILDPEIIDFLEKLSYHSKFGWLVPKQHLIPQQEVLSAAKFLRELQK